MQGLLDRLKLKQQRTLEEKLNKWDLLVQLDNGARPVPGQTAARGRVDWMAEFSVGYDSVVPDQETNNSQTSSLPKSNLDSQMLVEFNDLLVPRPAKTQELPSVAAVSDSLPSAMKGCPSTKSRCRLPSEAGEFLTNSTVASAMHDEIKNYGHFAGEAELQSDF